MAGFAVIFMVTLACLTVLSAIPILVTLLVHNRRQSSPETTRRAS